MLNLATVLATATSFLTKSEEKPAEKPAAEIEKPGAIELPAEIKRVLFDLIVKVGNFHAIVIDARFPSSHLFKLTLGVQKFEGKERGRVNHLELLINRKGEIISIVNVSPRLARLQAMGLVEFQSTDTLRYQTLARVMASAVFRAIGNHYYPASN